MGAKELACVIISVIIVGVTIANIIVFLLDRKRRQNAQQVAVVAAQNNGTTAAEAIEQPEQIGQPEQVAEEPVQPAQAEEVGQPTQQAVEEVAQPTEPVAEEPAVQEPTDDNSELDMDQILAAFASGNVEETDSGAIVHNADGSTTYLSFNKSFKAKLSQAKDEVKEYYNIVKNNALTYKKVRSSISWNQESVRFGKEKVCWLVLRGKSLYLYLPLNPDDYAESKYKVDRANAKRFEELPCLYKISSKRRAKYATELIDTVMERFGAERAEKASEDYAANYAFEETPSLIQGGQIKVTKSKRAFAARKKVEE